MDINKVIMESINSVISDDKEQQPVTEWFDDASMNPGYIKQLTDAGKSTIKGGTDYGKTGAIIAAAIAAGLGGVALAKKLRAAKKVAKRA
jgi:hypothetical protein